MQQLTQKLGSGEMKVQEVPLPQLEKGMVLVKNHYSVISAGTESTTVSSARKNLVQKAKEKPQEVKQVIDTLKTQGPVQTYRAVKKKLDAYSPLGYSSAGEIIAVGEGVTKFKVGDYVACAGVGYANHAEVVSVPSNLCVKLENGTYLKNAAYNTLGAIALQGIRQADLRLAESCAVIGLGLIGHLTGVMLKASGINTIGIDINPAAVEIAKKNSFDYSVERNTAGVEDFILNITDGLGVDAVIITAGTQSLDPINFAGKIARKKGKVIVVGAVPTGFDRNDYYKKELELKMSCSYGPGRYDLKYEEKGIDYPPAYVRWTENRNMKAFQNLLKTGNINIDFLTTHEFEFKEAPKAYDLILNKNDSFLGIVLKYDIEKKHTNIKLITKRQKAYGKIGIGFIGAGSYAQSHLLPNLPKNDKDVVNMGVLTHSGTTSKRVAEKYGFEFATSNKDDIFLNQQINTLFIATKHDSHGKFVAEGLKNNNNVFVEKPLCMNMGQLTTIHQLYQKKDCTIMVGFNRRFSPLSVKLKKQITQAPLSVIYRINAGFIPGESWIQDIEIGGGRIIGEVCHFIDYITWLTSSKVIKVHAFAIPDANGFNDTLNISLLFENGSIGSINYYSNGSKALPKEYIEVYQSGQSMILNDFRSLELYGKKKSKYRLKMQDKGQVYMMKHFIDSLKEGKEAPISFSDIYYTTLTSFKVIDSIKNGTVENV